MRTAAMGAILLLAAASGCRSTSHADRGLLFGGLLGAGTGAIVGDALGNPGMGTAIGAGVGAVAGGAMGEGLDEVEARNRAMIENQLGREVRTGAVTIDDVLMMSQAGVDDELIINHIRAHGVARVPGPHELISLKQQGVSTPVISTMQQPPPTNRQPVVVDRAPHPLIVEEHHYGPPCYPPPHFGVHDRHFRRHSGSRVGWGISFHN